MKKFLLLAIMLLYVSFIMGMGTNPLKQILKPDSLLVSNEYVYILEGPKCHIYMEKDNKIIRVIGKPGAGPGEVKLGPGFPLNSGLLNDGNIYLEGMSKIILYSKKGDYLKEIRKKGRIFKSSPLGENFVGVRFTSDKESKKNYLSLALFNKDYAFQKELLKHEILDNDTDIEMIVDSIHYSVYKNKIYIEDSTKGFCISVYNQEGKEINKIKKDVSFIELNKIAKRWLLNSFKNDDFIKMMVKRDGGWKRFEKKMKFIYPKHFPAIQDIYVANERIYVLTFASNRDNTKEKFIIMDLKGKILKESFLPVPIKSNYLSKMMGKDNKFYGFNKEFYYYLEEDEEDESFKLKKIKL